MIEDWKYIKKNRKKEKKTKLKILFSLMTVSSPNSFIAANTLNWLENRLQCLVKKSRDLIDYSIISDRNTHTIQCFQCSSRYCKTVQYTPKVLSSVLLIQWIFFVCRKKLLQGLNKNRSAISILYRKFSRQSFYSCCIWWKCFCNDKWHSTRC